MVENIFYPIFQKNYYICLKYNMNSSQNGGKSKSSKSSSSKSKKGGNFLGSASELFIPTGWESFATAAGLLAADRAAAAFRKSRNSSKKQKGGADLDLDAHESLENMEEMMASMGASDSVMSGGGKKKKSTAKKPAKKSAKKPAKKSAKKPAKKSKK
jgi:hypothetical protein